MHMYAHGKLHNNKQTKILHLISRARDFITAIPTWRRICIYNGESQGMRRRAEEQSMRTVELMLSLPRSLNRENLAR